MKLAVLFSGGKDSCLAMYKTMKEHSVVCLVSIISSNPESYMFHVPNIHLVSVQAEAIGLPLISFNTKGEKEKELEDLKKAIVQAKKEYDIEGVVTGAVRSEYQASRIQKICSDLNLKCINPLWHMDQIELLKELKDFEVMITGIFAYPLEKEWLGKIIDDDVISKLEKLQKEIQLNPAGEGGEIETTVLNAPFFKKKIVILESEIEYEKHAGVFKIIKTELVEK